MEFEQKYLDAKFDSLDQRLRAVETMILRIENTLEEFHEYRRVDSVKVEGLRTQITLVASFISIAVAAAVSALFSFFIKRN